MNSNDIKNYRAIKVKYIACTERKPERISLSAETYHNEARCETKTFSYDYEIDSMLDQAIGILERNGLKPVCRAWDKTDFIIMCDNFGNAYKSLHELK